MAVPGLSSIDVVVIQVISGAAAGVAAVDLKEGGAELGMDVVEEEDDGLMRIGCLKKGGGQYLDRFHSLKSHARTPTNIRVQVTERAMAVEL